MMKILIFILVNATFARADFTATNTCQAVYETITNPAILGITGIFDQSMGPAIDSFLSNYKLHLKQFNLSSKNYCRNQKSIHFSDCMKLYPESAKQAAEGDFYRLAESIHLINTMASWNSDSQIKPIPLDPSYQFPSNRRPNLSHTNFKIDTVTNVNKVKDPQFGTYLSCLKGFLMQNLLGLKTGNSQFPLKPSTLSDLIMGQDPSVPLPDFLRPRKPNPVQPDPSST